MALTDEEKQAYMKELREKDNKAREIKDKKSPRTAKEEVKEIKNTDSDKIIKELKEQLNKKDQQIKAMKDSQDDAYSEKSFVQENEALNAILKGNDGKNFVKEYDIPIDGSDKKTHFIIKMHLPTVIELSAIEQEFYDITKGRGANFTQSYAEIFRAISCFRVVGDEVPEWFKDPENSYRWDILVSVWLDFEEWSEFFRQTKFK